MAYLDKEAYERKREYAAKRMAENREITTLTDEQHDLLNELCTFRHDLHTNQKSAFNANSSDYSYYANNISKYYVGVSEDDLHSRIVKAFGTAPYTPIDYPTSEDYDDYGMTYEEAQEEAETLFDKINTQIENFLSDIDKKHGTNYCPSGATRIY